MRKMLASLYDAGWPLRALGEIFDPPIARTTIREWVLEAPENRPEAPGPTLKTPPPKPWKKPKPPIPATERMILSALANTAKNYRAGMSSLSPEAAANASLDLMIRGFFTKGHSVQELADATGLSKRTIYNRLKKTAV